MRRVWGDADVVLLVFGGAAAEFALNKAVDWLFFTGAIPTDPIGRLFKTAAYAQDIVFASRARADEALARIRRAHAAVERARGARIPEWAHRDVLYLLIDYTERAYALLERPLTDVEQDELYDVFRRVGNGLGIEELPSTYAEWRVDRERHMRRDLAHSAHSRALYARYRQELGPLRFTLMLRLQALLVPPFVAELLRLPRSPGTRAAVACYRQLRALRLASLARMVLVPAEYQAQVRAMQR